MKSILILLGPIVMLLEAGPAAAHHTPALFDMSTIVTNRSGWDIDPSSSRLVRRVARTWGPGESARLSSEGLSTAHSIGLLHYQDGRHGIGAQSGPIPLGAARERKPRAGNRWSLAATMGELFRDCREWSEFAADGTRQPV